MKGKIQSFKNMSTASNPSMNIERIFSLDLIRGISIILIIFFHYNCSMVQIVSSDMNLVKYYGYAGDIGVTMFFILSGASLTISTQKNFSTASFFKKRFLAIYPLFWTVYVLCTLGRTIILRTNLFPDRNPVTFILTIMGIDGLMTYRGPNYYLVGEWFLGCILILYGIYPLIRSVYHTINKHLFLMGCLILCLILEKNYSLSMPLIWFPLFRMFEFVFGMHFMTFYRCTTLKQNIILMVTAASGIMAVFLLNTSGHIFISNITVGIFCFVILACLSNMHGPVNPILKRLVSFLSKYAFTAFLVHHILLNQIVMVFHPQLMGSVYNRWAFFFITLGVIFLSAYMIYNGLKWLLRTPIAAL